MNELPPEAAMQELCEQVCRAGSALGARLEERRLPGGLFLFRFHLRDSRVVSGDAAPHIRVALYTACQAAMDALIP